MGYQSWVTNLNSAVPDEEFWMVKEVMVMMAMVMTMTQNTEDYYMQAQISPSIPIH